jgi:hypothetical protein
MGTRRPDTKHIAPDLQGIDALIRRALQDEDSRERLERALTEPLQADQGDQKGSEALPGLVHPPRLTAR